MGGFGSFWLADDQQTLQQHQSQSQRQQEPLSQRQEQPQQQHRQGRVEAQHVHNRRSSACISLNTPVVDAGIPLEWDL